VTVAEAGRTAELVLLVQVKVAGFALVTLLSLHIHLTGAHPRPGVAIGFVSIATRLVTPTGFAALVGEVW